MKQCITNKAIIDQRDSRLSLILLCSFFTLIFIFMNYTNAIIIFSMLIIIFWIDHRYWSQKYYILNYDILMDKREEKELQKWWKQWEANH